jgi:hypothetical protein
MAAPPPTVMAADPITDVGFVRWQRISALTPITLGTSGKASQYP